LLWAALTYGNIRGQQVHWAFGFILRIFLLVWVLFALAWITLGWVGRWLGLSLKRPGFAPLVALGLIIVPPVLLFSFSCFLVDVWNLDHLPERFFLPLMLWLGFLIFAGNFLALSLWAATHLRNNFRSMVISRDLPETRRARWRTNGRVVIRLAGGLVALVLLCAAEGTLSANQNPEPNDGRISRGRMVSRYTLPMPRSHRRGRGNRRARVPILLMRSAGNPLHQNAPVRQFDRHNPNDPTVPGFDKRDSSAEPYPPAGRTRHLQPPTLLVLNDWRRCNPNLKASLRRGSGFVHPAVSDRRGADHPHAGTAVAGNLARIVRGARLCPD
jgi:hypothetical protein